MNEIQYENLDALLRPVLIFVSECRRFKLFGHEVDMRTVVVQLRRLLDDTRNRAKADEELAKSFERLEKPLLFFVDFMMKKGDFSFSAAWREFSREANELSGDEKFFDCLDAVLSDPESQVDLYAYYLLMGLGFDGMYRGDPAEIESRMLACAEKLPQPFDVRREPLSEAVGRDMVQEMSKKGLARIWKVMMMSAVAALVALIFANVRFSQSDADYKKALADAVSEASGTTEIVRLGVQKPETATENRAISGKEARP